jgi:hypothetical protein
MNHHPSQSCIDAYLECVVACENWATACLSEQDVKSMKECIRLDRECAEICPTAARLMSQKGRFAARLCQLCAEVRDACAMEECGKHSHVEHCRMCAIACKACAGECKNLASVNVR